MESNWAIKEISDEEHKIINRLSEELTVSQDIAKLLVIRGINTFDEAKDFFRPSLDNLHDPFLMKDMSIAVDRVNKALRKQEKILVYGDYDVDGVTAVSVWQFCFVVCKRIDADILLLLTYADEFSKEDDRYLNSSKRKVAL